MNSQKNYLSDEDYILFYLDKCPKESRSTENFGSYSFKNEVKVELYRSGDHHFYTYEYIDNQ